MTRKICLYCAVIFLIFISCEREQLHTVENEKIKIETYKLSYTSKERIYSELTNKLTNETKRIFEANLGKFYGLTISNDSIIIQADLKNIKVYSIAKKEFGYKIFLVDLKK